MKPVSYHLLLLLLSLTAIAVPTSISATKIGITISSPASISGSVPISPERIVAKVVSMKIKAVRLLEPNPAMMRAFANTNVSLFLSIPNPLVPLLASDRSFALRWVYREVLPFHPRTKISVISVGNDVISSYSPDARPPLFLLPAMQNVQRSLAHLRMDKISVSTTFSFTNTIPMAFPPSSARFQQPNGELIIKPILKFLERTNSSFIINLHPYQIYRSSFLIPLGFALFGNSPLYFRDDLKSGVRYDNLFDMMVDAVISSMAAMGHKNLPLIVAATGWPSSGINASEVDATLLYSEMFLEALITRLRYGRGRRLRKEGVSEVYIFELVDTKQGVLNWGLVNDDMTN
ncbi:hypothetical protein EUTSA_v10005331mg, partial [Eutrema salsugineum]